MQFITNSKNKSLHRVFRKSNKRVTNFWDKHHLRKPDKKDAIYFIVAFATLGFSFGVSLGASAENAQAQTRLTMELSAQAVYYDGLLQEKQDLYDSVVGADIEDVDFSTMTRSQLLERIESLKIFIDSFESFEMTDMPMYEVLNTHLEECYVVLKNGEYKNPYTEEDYSLLAYAIWKEAGSSWLSDEHRDLVGMVIINRRNQGGINKTLTNPTIADIINETGQYPYKSWDYDPEVIPTYCWVSAKKCLEGEVYCPENVIWQATFKQGDGVYKTFYSEKSGTTTYFCYSD